MALNVSKCIHIMPLGFKGLMNPCLSVEGRPPANMTQSILWPWPRPDDLDIRVYLHTKNEVSRSRLLKVSWNRTDRQTGTTEGITTPHLRVLTSQKSCILLSLEWRRQDLVSGAWTVASRLRRPITGLGEEWQGYPLCGGVDNQG